MTLDEAIAHTREVAEKNRKSYEWYRENSKVWNDGGRKKTECLLCSEKHEQLVEWLEDYKRLKSIPEHTYENCHNVTCRRKCEKDGYNKAIADFVTRYKFCDNRSIQCHKALNCADCIAEQLKAGAIND